MSVIYACLFIICLVKRGSNIPWGGGLAAFTICLLRNLLWEKHCMPVRTIFLSRVVGNVLYCSAERTGHIFSDEAMNIIAKRKTVFI